MEVRALETHEQKEKRDKKRKMIGGIVLIGIMVLSSIGFAFFLGGGILGSGDEGGQSVNDEIYYNGQYWVVQKEGARAFLSVHPDELASLQNVKIEKKAHDYRGVNVFIDSENSEIKNLISANLAQYALSLREACYGSCSRDLPEKTCDENLIVWRASENERVHQENNCIFIEGDNAAVNSFIYSLFYRR